MTAVPAALLQLVLLFNRSNNGYIEVKLLRFISHVLILTLILSMPISATADEAAGKLWYGLVITSKGDIEEIHRLPREWKDVKPVTLPEFEPYKIKEQNEIKQYRNGKDEIKILKRAQCLVVGATLVSNGQVDAPLSFPVDMTSPAPGQQAVAGRRQTGPSVGAIPNTNPQQHRNSYSFEFHSDLNGVHGCTSEQFMKTFDALVHRQRALVGRVNGAGIANTVAFVPDLPASYRGNTRTGLRLIRGGVIYEGTPDIIHWLDSPGSSFTPQAGFAPFANIDITLLKSVTTDGTGQHGLLCLSGHTAITNLANGQVMAPNAARAMLDQIAPNGGNNAPPNLQDAARVLRTPKAQGGFQGVTNPEFRHLGCYAF